MVLFKGETCRSLTSENACQIRQHDNSERETDCPVDGNFDRCPLRADRGHIAGRPCLRERQKCQQAEVK